MKVNHFLLFICFASRLALDSELRFTLSKARCFGERDSPYLAKAKSRSALRRVALSRSPSHSLAHLADSLCLLARRALWHKTCLLAGAGAASLLLLPCLAGSTLLIWRPGEPLVLRVLCACASLCLCCCEVFRMKCSTSKCIWRRIFNPEPAPQLQG